LCSDFLLCADGSRIGWIALTSSNTTLERPCDRSRVPLFVNSTSFSNLSHPPHSNDIVSNLPMDWFSIWNSHLCVQDFLCTYNSHIVQFVCMLQQMLENHVVTLSFIPNYPPGAQTYFILSLLLESSCGLPGHYQLITHLPQTGYSQLWSNFLERFHLRCPFPLCTPIQRCLPSFLGSLRASHENKSSPYFFPFLHLDIPSQTIPQ
jgi:hypothetical protein